MTTPPNLVTLRSAPMLDPGEWCREVRNIGRRNQSSHYCPLWNRTIERCNAGYETNGNPRNVRRPQSCIDGQQPAQLPMLPSEDP